jgi:hypothetical protein
MIALDLRAQRLAWTENMLLADEIFQALRTKAFGQRTFPIGPLIGGGGERGAVEQAHVFLWRRAS